MPGHPFYTVGGTDTVEVSVPVAKGQGVEVDPSNPGKVRPWSAGSTRRVGVAWVGGAPPSSNAYNNMAPQRPHITVQRAPIGTRMQYASAAAWRQPLIAAANGQVTPAADDTVDAAQLVGYCDEPAGVTAGQVGRVELV